MEASVTSPHGAPTGPRGAELDPEDEDGIFANEPVDIDAEDDGEAFGEEDEASERADPDGYVWKVDASKGDVKLNGKSRERMAKGTMLTHFSEGLCHHDQFGRL